MRQTIFPGRTIRHGRGLRVGLLNNAPERAAKAVERRFRTLLLSLAPELAIQIDVFGIDCAAEVIFDGRLDALIVTGMEPRAARLQDEPAWPMLARIVDWAADRELPVAWSCLAAHVAVLHLDGIVREKLSAKLSGICEASLVDGDHWLACELPSHWPVPHSRWNDLPERSLAASGYRALSRIETGADVFTRIDLPFLFLQGHLEYDGSSLLLEFRRDVRRFFASDAAFPGLPTRCVDEQTGARILRLADAAQSRDPSVLARILDLLDRIPPACHAWHGVAERLFLNWLAATAGIGATAARVKHEDAVVEALL